MSSVFDAANNHGAQVVSLFNAGPDSQQHSPECKCDAHSVIVRASDCGPICDLSETRGLPEVFENDKVSTSAGLNSASGINPPSGDKGRVDSGVVKRTSIHSTEPRTHEVEHRGPTTDGGGDNSQKSAEQCRTDGKGKSRAKRSSATTLEAACPEKLPLHRLAEVRQQQGITQRTMARRLGIEIRRYRAMEDPCCDLSLSELGALQEALDVPIADLLEDRQSLSRPVQERAKLVKVMKTAVAIKEAKSNPSVQRMATMLCEQLVDLMPELQEVSAWPQFGARRGLSAIGKALQQPIDMSKLGSLD